MKLSMSLFAAGALVLGTTAMSASAAVFNEDGGSGAPVGVVLETNGEAGGFQVWDRWERTIANAEVISDSTITQINAKLWTNDADVWQINVTNAANFFVWASGGHTLAVFDAAGNALAAVLGSGSSSAIDGSWLSGNGIYYVGFGADGNSPRNAAGEDLFNLSLAVSAPVAGDTVLAADPFVAWSNFNGVCGFGCDPLTFVPQLIGPGNFTRPNPTVHIQAPEPASMALLGLGGLAMLRRRA